MNSLSGKKIILTGASGFIGSVLQKNLLEAGAEICSIVNSSRNLINHSNLKIIKGDLTSSAFVRKIFAIDDYDLLIHLAAREYFGGVEGIVSDLDVNVRTTLLMLEEIRNLSNPPKIIFISSANTFGGVSDKYVNELTDPKPLSFWSYHKLLSEYYLRIYKKNFNLESVSLVIPNIYGFSLSKETTLRMSVNKIIYSALTKHRISLYENKQIKRNFIHLNDLVEAITALAIMNNWNSSRYIVSGSDGFSFNDIAQVLLEIDPNITINYDTRNLDDFEMRDYLLDPSQFIKDSGWEPRIAMHDGIIQTYDDLKCIL